VSKRQKAEDNGSNPVEAAQSALAEATQKLAAHDAETEALKTQAAALEEALDRAVLAGAGAEATKASRDLAACKEFVSAKIRVRRVLAQAVADAEAAVKEAEAQAAREQIERLAKEKVEILTAIVEKIGEVCELLGDARAIQTTMDGLATDHNLPTPPRQRLMLARSLIRSQSAEELADALGAERAFGLDRTPAP